MTEPGASSFELFGKPRLPLDRLFDLRAHLDALLTQLSLLAASGNDFDGVKA
jgi:hypothetical protein